MTVVPFQLYSNLSVNIVVAMDSPKEKLSESHWGDFFKIDTFFTSHSELNTQECSKGRIGNAAL